MTKIQVSGELYDALWHCQVAAEVNDNSLGDSNYKQYMLVHDWLTDSVEIADDTLSGDKEQEND